MGTEVRLDAAGCLSLGQVLQAFNAPISEEHAWALFHQAAVAFRQGLRAQRPVAALAGLDRLLLRQDGEVRIAADGEFCCNYCSSTGLRFA